MPPLAFYFGMEAQPRLSDLTVIVFADFVWRKMMGNLHRQARKSEKNERQAEYIPTVEYSLDSYSLGFDWALNQRPYRIKITKLAAKTFTD